MSPDTTTCEDGTNRPFVKIIQQPASKFRFRYRTEQKQIHGAVQGENSTKKSKTYPTVKLCNYDNEAYIRCTLYSAEESNRFVHAHRLLAKSPDKKEDKDDPHDIKVGPDNKYEACFRTLVIIHTPKNLIIDELVKKKIKHQQLLDDNFSNDILQEITTEAKKQSKNMDLNKVSLRFDALRKDPLTGELIQICKPVYSKPIKNSRNPSTADLIICRKDKYIGSCKGEDEVFIFVEKVCKDDIKVRFFELNESGDEIWFDYAKFGEHDVHHQYAIAFRIPRYKSIEIDKNVPVYFQLERPSDRCFSEKMDFQYKPVYHITTGSKRKAVEQLPLLSPPPQPLAQVDTQLYNTNGSFGETCNLSDGIEQIFNSVFFDLNHLLTNPEQLREDFNDAMMPELSPPVESNTSQTKEQPSPTYEEEFMKVFNSIISTEYEEQYFRNLPDEPEIEQSTLSLRGMDNSSSFTNIVADGTVETQSGVMDTTNSSNIVPSATFQMATEYEGMDNSSSFTNIVAGGTVETQSGVMDTTNSSNIVPSATFQMATEYEGVDNSSSFTNIVADGVVKTQSGVMDTTDSSNIVPSASSQMASQYEERVEKWQNSFWNKYGRQAELHCYNYLDFSRLFHTLFLAVMMRLIRVAAYIVTRFLHAKEKLLGNKGVGHAKENIRKLNAVKKTSHVDNRSTKLVLHKEKVLFPNDVNHIYGGSILHMAVTHGKETVLEILLDKCKTTNTLLSCIDSKNCEQKTPLHIAATLKLEKAVDLLLSNKADPSVQDTFGNTPLHYATVGQNINIVKMLVNAMEYADIEAMNEVGQTVLHIAVGQKSYRIVEILIKAGADVNRHNGCTGDTPLHIAVNNRDLQMLNILLKEEGIDIDTENFSQCTPLTYLLDSKNTEAANEICNTLLKFKQQQKSPFQKFIVMICNKSTGCNVEDTVIEEVNNFIQ